VKKIKECPEKKKECPEKNKGVCSVLFSWKFLFFENVRSRYYFVKNIFVA